MCSLLTSGTNRTTAVAVPAAIFLVGSAFAAPDLDSWREMRGRVVNAFELIGSDVSNGVTPMGMISDLVLTPDGSAVQYFLYEVPYPVRLWGAEDGFVAFDDVTFERGVGLDIAINFDAGESARRPEELELPVEQFDHRLVSRVLDRPMEFRDGATMEIQNLLVDRRTGDVTYYVVELDSEALIRSRRRAVPVEQVTLTEEGALLAALRVDELDGLQEFDPAFL